VEIRPARAANAPELLKIYRPFVESTTVSFEEAAPGLDEFAARIEKSLAGWQWLVACEEGACVGYAYASAHRERSAYRWSVEVSAYVDAAWQRRGIGRELYLALFADLARKGYCNAYAGIALPNEASVALHRGVGFTPCGVFHRIGRKFGRWHDVAWFERPLREEPSTS
jgi:L-amino acid N-acyltransferase YncA